MNLKTQSGGQSSDDCGLCCMFAITSTFLIRDKFELSIFLYLPLGSLHQYFIELDLFILIIDKSVF